MFLRDSLCNDIIAFMCSGRCSTPCRPPSQPVSAQTRNCQQFENECAEGENIFRRSPVITPVRVHGVEPNLPYRHKIDHLQARYVSQSADRGVDFFTRTAVVLLGAIVRTSCRSVRSALAIPMLNTGLDISRVQVFLTYIGHPIPRQVSGTPPNATRRIRIT